MTGELDLWFPRQNRAPKKVAPPTPDPDGTTPPIWFREAVPERKAKPRDPNKVTAKKLERIGEGLTKDVLKKFGISLSKIPLIESYYGYKSIDVDFRGSYQGRPLKVEAKTWWRARKNFPLSRFSRNERGYMRRGIAEGFQCWVTFAVLDTEPRRGACNALYVLTWQEWVRIEAELLARAAGNYKGRSMRKRDLDLLDGFAIVRKSRRWTLPPGHWLVPGARVLPAVCERQ